MVVLFAMVYCSSSSYSPPNSRLETEVVTLSSLLFAFTRRSGSVMHKRDLGRGLKSNEPKEEQEEEEEDERREGES